MISLYDLLEAANGQLFGEAAAQLFTGFCLEPRAASENQMFVARRTDRGDTHQHIHEAVERGVRGVLCVQPPEFDTAGVSVIIVKDTEAALMAWAQHILTKLRTRVIAVTGTASASTAVSAVCQVLAVRYAVHTCADDQHGRLRLPLALAELRPDHKMFVLELAPAEPGDVAELAGLARPDVAVVTHAGLANTETFASVDEIVREMSALVEQISADGLAVLNYDDDEVRALAGRTRARVVTVGATVFGADIMAYNIVAGLTKTGFDLRHGQERHIGRWTPLLGRHYLYSALFGLAVGQHYGIPLDEGLKALTLLKPLPGRMKPLRGVNGALIVDDTYNALPQPTLAALDWLAAAREADQRTVFVLGDLEGLGPLSQRCHRQIGQRAAAVADLVITGGAEAALAGRAALDEGLDRRRVVITYSPQDVIAALRDDYPLGPDDIVLVAGGRTARMEQVVKALLQDPADRDQLVRQQVEIEPAAAPRSIHTTWVEIDKGALANNVRLVRQIIGSEVALMAVVKADAYGHGAVAASVTALANGAQALGVASLPEALALREAGIEAPILVMSYTPVYAVRQALRHNVTLTLYDLDIARAYNQAAREMGVPLRVHVKIDTGMGRLGVLADEAVPFFRHLASLPHLDIEGIYTHFSMADEDPLYTADQLRAFKSVVNPLRASGFSFRYIHAANSAATLTAKDTHLNMVRVGIALYGLSPSETVPIPPAFEPVMAWKTVIAQVKTLPPGHPVGYGQTYVTSGYERIAVIPVGYAHGFRRKPHNWGQVLVHGQYAPIAGRVSMEKTCINVTHIPGVAVGDEVVLIGRQGSARITAEDVAKSLGTNNYEVVCSVLARVPRQ